MLLTTSFGSFISRNIETEEDGGALPDEEKELLRISPNVLRHLASTYHVPSAFFVAISRERPEFGSSFRRRSKHEWDYWCVLPCRAAATYNSPTDMWRVPFEEQMDPFSDISFEGQGTRIEAHTVALYINRDCGTRKLRVFVVNTAKQWWLYGGQEPLAQIRNGLERKSSMDIDGSPCFVLLLYISSMLRWWNIVLVMFDGELISHVRSSLYL